MRRMEREGLYKLQSYISQASVHNKMFVLSPPREDGEEVFNTVKDELKVREVFVLS